MAITPLSAKLIFTWALKHQIQGRCLQLGRQDILLTAKDLGRLLSELGATGILPGNDVERQRKRLDTLLGTDYAMATRADLREKQFVSDRLFFELLGFAESKSLDASNFEGADIVYDMNLNDISRLIDTPFDLVIETGTAEHIFHYPNYCKNIFHSLATGGHVIHFNPVNNFVDHGFYQFSPTLFYDYYTTNRFELLDFRLLETKSDDWSEGRMDRYEPGAFDTMNRDRFSHVYVIAGVVARKDPESTCDVIPQQRIYQEKLDWSVGLSTEGISAARSLGTLSPPFAIDSGYCWQIQLPQEVGQGDTANRPYRSRLVVLENGSLLGKPHALHTEIRDKGKGRYSHWNDGLYFSTSDNSDPNVNGRTYELRLYEPKTQTTTTADKEQERLTTVSPIIKSPIFIIGCGRSGTTLLFDLLKQHPQISATTGYPDGEDHMGWVQHGKALISGLGYANKDGGKSGLCYCLYMDENDLAPQTANAMAQYYATDVLKGDQSKRVLNKCPHLSNKLRYVRAMFPDAKFVHIIRDCLPVVASWITLMEKQLPQVLYWPDTPFPCFWVMQAPVNGQRKRLFEKEDRLIPGGGTARLVDYWATVNRNIPLQLSQWPDQLLTVKYEDLCADPSSMLERIFRFCQLDATVKIPVTIDPSRNLLYKHHLTKTQIDQFLNRAAETRSQFAYGSIDHK